MPFPAQKGQRGEGPGVPQLLAGLGWAGRWPRLEGTGSLLKPGACPGNAGVTVGSGSVVRDVSSQSVQNPLGMLVEGNAAFPYTQAHPEQCFKVEKIIFLDAKKIHKCDQKGPYVLATRNENKA